MKSSRTAALHSLIMIVMVLVAGCALAPQPELPPKESIPSDIPDEVRTEIVMLYSSSPVSRAEGAKALGRMGEQAMPAVPFLIAELRDREKLNITNKSYSPSGKVVTEKYSRTVGEFAQEALQKITGQDFGQDIAHWEQWWEENKSSLAEG